MADPDAPGDRPAGPGEAGVGTGGRGADVDGIPGPSHWKMQALQEWPCGHLLLPGSGLCPVLCGLKPEAVPGEDVQKGPHGDGPDGNQGLRDTRSPSDKRGRPWSTALGSSSQLSLATSLPQVHRSPPAGLQMPSAPPLWKAPHQHSAGPFLGPPLWCRDPGCPGRTSSSQLTGPSWGSVCMAVNGTEEGQVVC